jgi:hypothetical protein
MRTSNLMYEARIPATNITILHEMVTRIHLAIE